MTIPDYAQQAARYRAHSEECRALAEATGSERAREEYAGLASSYQGLADDMEFLLKFAHWRT